MDKNAKKMKGNPYFIVLLSTLLLTLNNVFCAPLLVSDTVIRVYGKVIDQQSKVPVSGSITYEKLPYGDDMGISHSREGEGNYQMYLLKHSKYLIKVKANGYYDLSTEMSVTQVNEQGEFNTDFELTPTFKQEMIRLENLIFATGRSEITPSSYPEIDMIAEMINDRPQIKIQLEGHTDYAGNSDANMRLSQERVESVRDYLVKAGVKKSRILLKAFGGSKPLTNDRSDQGRRMNRRVEVRVIEN